MKARLYILFFFFSFFLVQGCGTSKTIVGDTYNPLACSYVVRSLSNPTLSGKDLSKGINFSVVSEIGSILAGNQNAVPLDFVMNMRVTNPNDKKVVLQSFDYILRVDNVELTRGTYAKALTIPAGKTKPIPLPIHLDLVSLIQGTPGSAAQNILKNFTGTATSQSHIVLQIKPSYKVGKEVLVSPRYHIYRMTLG